MNTDRHTAGEEPRDGSSAELDALSSSWRMHLESRIIEYEEDNCESRNGFSALMAAAVGDLFRTVAALEGPALEEFQQLSDDLPVHDRPQLRRYLAAVRGLGRIAHSELQTIVDRQAQHRSKSRAKN